MEGGKGVVDFDELVRIFVDTDVDTHFIVSLPRTSTVFELRELVKETHRHCYPNSGDVEIGKLAVPGGDYGYHLADFLLIGQAYDRYEGKVFAEVKNSSQGLFRSPPLSFKTSSKRVPLPAKQPFENGEGMVSTNGSEPGALLAVGSNACELIAPKPQKEEIDEDGNCVGFPRRSAIGCFERIEEEVDEKLEERLEAEVSLLPDKITAHAVSSDIPGSSRKRDAPECNERPSKSRRVTEPALLKAAPLEDDDLWNAAASLSLMNRFDDLDSNHLSPSGSKRRRRKKQISHVCDLTVSDRVMLEVEDKDESQKEETDLVIGSGVGGDAGVDGEGPLPEDSGVLAGLDVLGEKKRKLKKPRKVKEPELEKELDDEKEETMEGQEKKDKKGKKEKKLKLKKPEQEMELEREKDPEEVEEMVVRKDKKIKKEKKKKQKKEKNLKPEESPQEKVPEADEVLKDEQVLEEEKEEATEKKLEQKEPEREMEEEPEEVEEKEKKSKEEKKEKERKQKQKEPQQETELEKEKELEEERMEKNEKNEKKQEQTMEAVTPLDCPSLNPPLEESEREPQQQDGQAGVSPDLSDHAVHDEEDDDDVPGSEAMEEVQKKGDQNFGRPDFLRDEVSESGTPEREAQVSGEGTTLNGGMAKGFDDKVATPRTSLFGVVNDMEASPSYQGGTDPSSQTQDIKTGSLKCQESPNSSKQLSYTRAGRGAPSQTRSTESSRDMTKGKQTGGRNSKANESQSSQRWEKATQQSEGINLDSEVSGAWLRRGLLESEPGHIDQSQAAKPAYSRNSSSGESSAESDPRFADQTEVSMRKNHVPESSHINHAVKRPEKHDAKRSDGGEVNIKNDSLEFFSQDQSFHVAPTQVQKALSGSTTEESRDESDDEDTDSLKKQTSCNLNKEGGEAEESSDESGDLAIPARTSFSSLATRTPLPTVARMTGNGGSQSFKRRASGVAAEIEAKFAQFIESQGGLDEIMGITLGQRKRSMPVESSTQGAGSLAMPFGSPLDLALNTQESVKTSPIALDIAQASQSLAGKYFTPQFKVPKPVAVGTTSGVLNSAAAPTAMPLPGRGAPKARTVKELRLKRKEPTPPVDKSKESGGLLAKHNDANPLPALEPPKDTVAAEREAGNSSFLSPPKTPKGALLYDPNASKSSLLKSSEKKKRQEEKQQDSQFMIVNNTDCISEEEKKRGSDENGSLKSGRRTKGLKVKKEMVEIAGVVGSQEMLVLDSSGKKKKRKASEKEGSRKKRMKFLPEDMDGKEVTVLPENSVERSARETEELYVKLEKANRDLWLQNNSVSSFRKEEERIGNCAADLDDTEGGEDVAQSRLVPEEEPQVEKLPVRDQLPPPSPVLCAGTTEASDRDDSVYLSQDEKAETSQQRGKFTPTNVFDFVSGDELPTRVLSKKKSEVSEKKKAKQMEELSGRAVQRVLEDEMLHVADASDTSGKKSRKGAKPVKWTVRMRSLSPVALATSPHGGTVPSDAGAAAAGSRVHHAEFRSIPKVVNEAAAQTKPSRVTKTPRVLKPKRTPVPELYNQSGVLVCPMGCGRPYSKKSSAYYLHRQTCTGAPM